MPNARLVKPRQSGISMIGLMVGLLLAMIAILAGMTLYQSMVRTSIETRTDATQDGQLASALLSLQLELQSAGFGMVAGASPHIELSGLAGTNPQSLYWRHQPAAGGTVTCKGFRIQTNADETSRQLQLLQPKNPVACTATVLLSGIEWSIANVVAEFRASTAADAKLPTINMTLANQSCFPYGLGQAAVHPQVTITADNAARRAALTPGTGAATAAPNEAFVYSFCLPNL